MLLMDALCVEGSDVAAINQKALAGIEILPAKSHSPAECAISVEAAPPKRAAGSRRSSIVQVLNKTKQLWVKAVEARAQELQAVSGFLSKGTATSSLPYVIKRTSGKTSTRADVEWFSGDDARVNPTGATLLPPGVRARSKRLVELVPRGSRNALSLSGSRACVRVRRTLRALTT